MFEFQCSNHFTTTWLTTIVGVARSKHTDAEESDEALEISSNEESGTDRDDTKESMDQSTSESLQSGSPTVISLLDRLRSPTPADLSRKRHLRHNPPPKGVKTGKGKEKGILNISLHVSERNRIQMKHLL